MNFLDYSKRIDFLTQVNHENYIVFSGRFFKKGTNLFSEGSDCAAHTSQASVGVQVLEIFLKPIHLERKSV